MFSVSTEQRITSTISGETSSCTGCKLNQCRVECCALLSDSLFQLYTLSIHFHRRKNGEEVMEGRVGVREGAVSPSFSFHVVIYSVCVINSFYPSGWSDSSGCVVCPTSQQPLPSSLSLSLSIRLYLSRPTCWAGPLSARHAAVRRQKQACGSHGNRFDRRRTERAQTQKALVLGLCSTFFLCIRTEHNNKKDRSSLFMCICVCIYEE